MPTPADAYPKRYFLIQLPTTVGQLLGNIDERMPATVSRRILVTSVTIPLREGKARILKTPFF